MFNLNIKEKGIIYRKPEYVKCPGKFFSRRSYLTIAIRERERKKERFSTVISGAVAATAVKYDLRIRTRSGGDKLSITRERNGPHGCLRERSLAR